MSQHDDDFLKRARALLSGSEIDEALEKEFEGMETERQIGQDVAVEEGAIEERLQALAAADDREEIALLLDDLEAWLLSPYTRDVTKYRIRQAIINRLNRR